MKYMKIYSYSINQSVGKMFEETSSTLTSNIMLVISDKEILIIMRQLFYKSECEESF